MKNKGFNPFLPSWEYVPDGEPHIFEDGSGGKRVYLYGSHDMFNGYAYCMNDYICWSAPVNDLTSWRYEGVIFQKIDDPNNKDAAMHLYAPDVTQGPDGRYYLYYVLDKMDTVGVAVCETPAGKYEHAGYVHYTCGTLLGKKEGDVPQFDPAVLTEENKTYLYSGQCNGKVRTVEDFRNYSIAVVLGSDMLTIEEGPFTVIPGCNVSKGTGFEGHEFFEASSIRKIDDTYYFVYSSFAMNELCYATSKSPVKDFKYGGVIISNADMGIDSYKSASKLMYHGNNNHGGIVKAGSDWYVFYHRHTNGNEFSRQACMEKIFINKDGSIKQVEMTSCGPNGAPLEGKGEYPAYIACNIFSMDDNIDPVSKKPYWPNRNPDMPFITQDARDASPENAGSEHGFIANILDNCGAGFKYFDCKGVKKIKVKIRGYCRGFFEVKTKWNESPAGKIDIVSSNIWKNYSADIPVPDGIHAFYFIYRGTGSATLGSITLE